MAGDFTGDSDELEVSADPDGTGVVDLDGALAYAAQVAAAVVDLAAVPAEAAAVRDLIDAYVAVGAAIRRTGGDHVQAGLRDPAATGWVGVSYALPGTDGPRSDEGVSGFVLAGVDYVTWPLEAELTRYLAAG